MIIGRTPSGSLSRAGKVLLTITLLQLPLAPVRAEDRPKAAPATRPASAAVIDDSTRKAVASLLEMAQDDNPPVQEAGRNAIVRFGPRAVPALIEALGRDEKSAGTAQQLLPAMGIEAIEALIEWVDSTDATAAMRERALATLERVLASNANQVGGMEGGVVGLPPGTTGGFSGVIGLPMASPQTMSIASWVIAPAAKASGDSNVAVRRASVRVLGVASRILFNPAVAAPLGAALKDEDSSVRRLAAEAMLSLSQLPPDLSEPLATAVNDSDQSVRVAALAALASLGPGARGAMPTVIAALKDSNPQVRIAAANALGAMQATVQPQPQPTGLPPPAVQGFTETSEGIVSPQGNAGVWVGAENVWHWTKLKRYDLAKRDADKMLKLSVPQDQLLMAFYSVSQERKEDFTTWLNRMQDVKELKELVAQLNAANSPNVLFPAEGGALPIPEPATTQPAR